jgi:hypothetical protein
MNSQPDDVNQLRDFTASPRILSLALLAVAIGSLGAAAAWILLKLIALCTNLAYFGRLSDAPVDFAGMHLPLWTVAVPVGGSLIIGLMARYGSEKIRGHGIPEAIEAILIGQSRIQPKVALLKPISSAISNGRHDRRLRHPHRGGAAGGRTAAVRMEAAQLHSRHHRGPGGAGLAAAADRQRSALSL